MELDRTELRVLWKRAESPTAVCCALKLKHKNMDKDMTEMF